MDRARVFASLPDGCVLEEDADWLFVAKPAGVASQSPDPTRPDDIVFRLRERFGYDYLGLHQRLDRETSGVMVFAKTRGANRPLASAFEGREVKKTYVAAVVGWPETKESAVLDQLLDEGDGGRMRVVTRGGARAITRVKVRGRRGPRALLELDLVTGRTHQARVQLAHAGAPIAGDALYGGARGPLAPRLLLHAERLSLPHPSTGNMTSVAAKLPPEFGAWLAGGDPGHRIYDEGHAAPLLDLAVRRAFDRRFGLGRDFEGASATTAFRVVNEGGDGLPGLAVDLYDGFAVAQFYEDDSADGGGWNDERRDRVAAALDRIGVTGVYVKRRPKQANTLVDPRRGDVAPPLPVRGVAASPRLVVYEEGMPLLVRLGEGLQTGIFLDQRKNRARVRGLAGGARVLNLFSFTCGFTVAAALGGAASTVSVDASAAALEWGRENLAQAGVIGADAAAHTFVCDDAFAWLARAAKKAERFDLVILDPPSYATTKSRRFVLEDDLAELVALALAVTARTGRMLVSINHRKTTHRRFRRILEEAVLQAGRPGSTVRDAPPALDYPVAPGAEPSTKAAWIGPPEKSKRPL